MVQLQLKLLARQSRSNPLSGAREPGAHGRAGTKASPTKNEDIDNILISMCGSRERLRSCRLATRAINKPSLVPRGPKQHHATHLPAFASFGEHKVLNCAKHALGAQPRQHGTMTTCVMDHCNWSCPHPKHAPASAAPPPTHTHTHPRPHCTCCKHQFEQSLLEASLHQRLPGRQAACVVAADAPQEGGNQLVTHTLRTVVTARHSMTQHDIA